MPIFYLNVQDEAHQQYCCPYSEHQANKNNHLMQKVECYREKLWDESSSDDDSNPSLPDLDYPYYSPPAAPTPSIEDFVDSLQI